MIQPTPTCLTLELEGIYAEGHYLFAEFVGGSMMRYPFPAECIEGVVFDFDTQAGTWEIEGEEDTVTMTTAELLDNAAAGEVEFYLGLYNMYHFKYTDHALNAWQWLTTTRTAQVYAPTLADAYAAFHARFKGATNVDNTSLQRVSQGRVLVQAA